MGRGPYPLFKAITDARDSWGVTAHVLAEEGFDTGDILAQETFAMAPQETHETLLARCQIAARRLASGPIARDLPARWQAAQPQGEGSYWARATDADRTLDFRTDVEAILRRMRAFGTIETIARLGDNSIFVAAAEGWREPHRHAPGTIVHRYRRHVVIAARDGFIQITRWSPGRRRGCRAARAIGRGPCRACARRRICPPRSAPPAASPSPGARNGNVSGTRSATVPTGAGTRRSGRARPPDQAWAAAIRAAFVSMSKVTAASISHSTTSVRRREETAGTLVTGERGQVGCEERAIQQNRVSAHAAMDRDNGGGHRIGSQESGGQGGEVGRPDTRHVPQHDDDSIGIRQGVETAPQGGRQPVRIGRVVDEPQVEAGECLPDCCAIARQLRPPTGPSFARDR